MKQKRAFILIALGLFLACYSVVSSGAITMVVFDRSSTAADTVPDSSAILALSGFSNESYVLNNNFQQIGIISNNSSQRLDFEMWIDPNITKIRSKSTQWTITIRLAMSDHNYRECIFTGTGTTNPLEQGTYPTISIPPGHTLSVTGKLVISDKKGFLAKTAFRFEASSNGLNLIIPDTDISPRRHTYSAQ